MMSAMAETAPAGGGGGRSRRDGRGDDTAGLFRPLRRYVRGTTASGDGGDVSNGVGGGGSGLVVVPMRPSRAAGSTEGWDGSIAAACASSHGGRPRKVARTAAAAAGDEDGRAEIARLRKELEESREVVERWKSVNNQLMAKIKGK